MITLLLFSGCKGKKEKIEIESIKGSGQTNLTDPTLYSDTKINPKLFFQITLEINTITAKYLQMQSEDPKIIELNMEKREKEIQNIYEKYSITEKEYQQFGQMHYRELEKFLEENPEVDEKLTHSR